MAALALPLLLQAAGGKPDFSGEWKMDASKSDFGPMPTPEKVSEKIIHKDPSLEVSSVQVDSGTERKVDLSYRTDGTPTKSKVGENDVTSTANWDGSTLAIESKMQTPGATLTFRERWTMAEDGKSLTIDRTVSTNLGDIKFKIALVRQ
jgi:hypothetical protein